ncbi:hypothetical protein J2Z60_000591 [Lactobacillus colini]|uniref:Uncharacterized protein n=1 Tax=Lactobacillus colini TaxID=1819254 RepID=A0ABS4MCL3_9LACO|nr:hypothetical protein [Lactobacillus colini]MBP2057427.1 hypothetical protein [Lactobacillus colini]
MVRKIIVDTEPHAGYEMGSHDPSKNNIRRHYVVMSITEYNHAAIYVFDFVWQLCNHITDCF